MKLDIKYNLVDISDILKVKKSEIHINLKEEMNFYEIFDILFSLYKNMRKFKISKFISFTKLSISVFFALDGNNI
jgi:hypothetical protein